LRVAGLDPAAVQFHVIRDRVLNAFVAGGQRVFLTTGLLRRAGNAGQITGVIAHELGHIAGGHLVRSRDAMRTARSQALIGTLLGVAAGILTRNPEAAMAIGSGGSQVAERSYLSYSRAQESSADQAAVRYLDGAGLSARGTLQFLSILGNQELLTVKLRDAYAVTHPLTRTRISFIRNFVAKSPNSDRPDPPGWADLHARIVAKLDGFLDQPARTLRRYKEGDRSIAARYARAVAYFRIPALDKALPLIDGLIAERPKDPYFQELKGQMLFENGRLEPALSAYGKAVALLPDNALLRTSMAHVQLELGREDLIPAAIKNLEAAIRLDRFVPRAWQLAGTAYGRNGQLGRSALALAEYNLRIGRKPDARALATRAKKLLKRGSPGWLRAEDILQTATKKR
jgi:predicted Zn-dependent protease